MTEILPQDFTIYPNLEYLRNPKRKTKEEMEIEHNILLKSLSDCRKDGYIFIGNTENMENANYFFPNKDSLKYRVYENLKQYSYGDEFSTEELASYMFEFWDDKIEKEIDSVLEYFFDIALIKKICLKNYWYWFFGRINP